MDDEANYDCTHDNYAVGPPVVPATDCLPVCNLDGTIQGAEKCDDGDDTNSDDGCTECKIDEYWECPGNVCAPICGDDHLVWYPPGDPLEYVNEECDDGN